MASQPRMTARMSTGPWWESGFPLGPRDKSHIIRVEDYTKKKGMGPGNFFRLETFKLGGLDWSIRFYPDGPNETYKEYVGICLELVTSNTKAQVDYHICFRGHHPTLVGTVLWFPGGKDIFKSTDPTNNQLRPRHRGFIYRSTLEDSCLHDDCLILKCDLTVITQSRLSEIEVEPTEIKK